MRLLHLALVALCLVAGAGRAEEASAVILDQYASWRMFDVLKAPQIAYDDGVRPIIYRSEHYWLNGETSAPPADWTKREFDDGEWLRGPAGMGCHAPFVARACLRGRFRVTDPAQVSGLKLAVSYHGGVVVYLNGAEAGRKDLAAEGGLAQAYPLEAFVTPDGKLFGTPEKPDAEALRRMALRRRTLELELPARLLRQGVNVLAIEIVRAPCPKAVDDQKSVTGWTDTLYSVPWNTCEVLDLRLTAGGKGAEANATRPPGFQVWNSPLLRSDFAFDFGDPCEPVRPIVISGAQNGAYSEKVVLGSTKPIRALKATMSELRGAGGSLPASALQVRFAVQGGAEYGICNSTFGFGKSTAHEPLADALGVLLEAPPAEYAVVRAATAHVGGAARAVFGAVAPVWVTARIPTGAKAGRYEGSLTLSCEGEKTIDVPVRLDVADWALPDPEKYRTWMELIQSPDTLALEYNVPLWSDKHFELIARSFRLMHEVGSSVLYLPLICCTDYGNEESIVRWVKKGDEYDFDFTALDRYLDVAEKNLGKPKVVCFIVWDIFVYPADLYVSGDGRNYMAKKQKGQMTDPFVTTLDPATGKLDRTSFPNYFKNAASKAQWTKLFSALHQRMQQRGLEQAMMLGWFTDLRAQKDEIAFWHDVTGDLPWVSHAHMYASVNHSSEKAGFKVGYQTAIHSAEFPIDPAKARFYGWKNPVLQAQQYIRVNWRGEMDTLPGSMWTSLPEINITGKQRGFGRVGGDCWLVLKDKKGQRAYRAYERYPWSVWSGLEQRSSALAPGPDGAVATNRFEQLREGVQGCEARICIESALTDKARRQKLGDELAGRAQAALDERILYALRSVCKYNMYLHYYNAPWTFWFQDGESGHAWVQSTGWRGRNATLYALAGEVEKK